MVKNEGPKSRRYKVITIELEAILVSLPYGDFKIRSWSLNVELDLQIFVIHIHEIKNEGPKSRRYEVIALTSHLILDSVTW